MVQIKEIGKFEDPKFLQTVELNKRGGNEPKLGFLKNQSAHLSSYVRARDLHSLREGNGGADQMINAALESASTFRLPALREEAVALRNNRSRAGPNKVTKTMGTQVLLGCPHLVCGVAVSPTWIGEEEWLVADFGDTIPLIENDPVSDHYVKEWPKRINL